MIGRIRQFGWFGASVGMILVLGGCAENQPPPPGTTAVNAAPAATDSSAVTTTVSTDANLPPIVPPAPPPPPAADRIYPVMVGIDVLAAQNFAPIAGKRVGLLTHPPGVNRDGVSTIEVLRHAPNVKLVALYGPEHGVFGSYTFGKLVPDTVDKKTGLPVLSLYGEGPLAMKRKLKGIQALVIDLQDIGVRSYSFSAMLRYAMEACFESGIEVVVLDRPNPLGGLKVDGPLLERELMSGIGAYRIPYVHGLTIGEIANMAAAAPGVLEIPEAVRAKGKLTVIPMRGWKREMRWTETGLKFVPTSQLIQNFETCVGYAMIGPGTQIGGFTSGVGPLYPFRGLAYPGKTTDVLIKELEALHVPGVSYRKINTSNKAGKPATGIYVDISDWEAWHPTELSFQLMRLACKFSGTNPFANAKPVQARGLNIILGSNEWWTALKRDGAKVDVEAFVKEWQQKNQIYQQVVRKYWLYSAELPAVAIPPPTAIVSASAVGTFDDVASL